MESRKMVQRIYLQDGDGETKVENRLMDTGWGRKEMVGFMERVIWKPTLPYVK